MRFFKELGAFGSEGKKARELQEQYHTKARKLLATVYHLEGRFDPSLSDPSDPSNFMRAFQTPAVSFMNRGFREAIETYFEIIKKHIDTANPEYLELHNEYLDKVERCVEGIENFFEDPLDPATNNTLAEMVGVVVETYVGQIRAIRGEKGFPFFSGLNDQDIELMDRILEDMEQSVKKPFRLSAAQEVSSVTERIASFLPRLEDKEDSQHSADISAVFRSSAIVLGFFVALLMRLYKG